MTPYNQPEANLARVLSIVAGIFGVLTLAGLVGAYLGNSTSFFVQTPWVTNSVAGLGMLGLLAWFGAADVRRFRDLVRVLVGGLAIGAAAFLLLCLGPHGAEQVPILLGAAIIYGGLALVVGLTLRRTPLLPPVLPWNTDKPLTASERVGRVVFVLFGIGASAFSLVLLALAFVGPVTDYFVRPIMIGGLTVKLGLLGVLGLLAARRIRDSDALVTVIVLVNGVSLLAGLLGWAGVARFGGGSLVLGGQTLTTGQIMPGIVALDLVVVVGLTVLQIFMNRSRLDYLGYLSPGQFRTIEALADCLVEGTADGRISSREVALRLDRYLSSFNSTRLVLTRVAVAGLELAPLLWLHPPISLLAPCFRRDFVDRRFKANLAARQGVNVILDLLRNQLQGVLRIAMQGVYVGYYSDPKVHSAIGYTPFSQRYADYARIKPIRKYRKLQVTTPEDVRRQGLDVIPSADVVIVGSGAGGSILAEQLLAQGRDVIVLEKGLYVDPDSFTEDEVASLGRLYGDGALQVSQSYRFQIIQGNCVGGGTVVNNAVCFDTPQRVLDDWNDPQGANAGIDAAAFRASQAWIKQRLQVQSIKDSTATRRWEDVLNPGDRLVTRGIEALGLRPGEEYDVVRANITDCLGCGYCNIGCKFGRKLSMLDEVLPKAQQEHGADRFRIFSEAEVVKLNGTSDGTQNAVNEIVVRLRDGRQLLIRNPKTVVLSAGPIASSWILMQSGIGAGELPVGRHLCFNMGSPLHAYLPSIDGGHLDSFAGLQIAHYLEPAEREGDRPRFVYETWFNPPVAQAMAMPGWLDRHELNMRRYRDLCAVGVLVGSEPNAYVTPAAILRGTPDVVYKPSERDLQTLLDALMMLGQVLFAGGAEEVMASAMSYREEAIFREPSELKRLTKLVRDDRDIVLGTGHPQGGNAMSKVRGQDRGVIDPDFRVYGYANLYVCDGSVHPSPTTVNPQLTIMSLAHYAGQRIR